jgi:hypothetical protein
LYGSPDIPQCGGSEFALVVFSHDNTRLWIPLLTAPSASNTIVPNLPGTTEFLYRQTFW